MNNPLKTAAPAAETKKDESPSVPTASYSCHPIENFGIGRFVFEKGLLQLEGPDVEVFETLYESLPPVEKSKIKKLDVAAAEAFVKNLLENAQPAATQVIDSSTGERAKPVVGTGRLEDSNPAPTDDSAKS